MHPFWLAKTFWWWVSHPGTDRAKHCLTSVSTPPAALPLGHGARLCQPRSSSDTAAPTGDKRKKNRLSRVLLGELASVDPFSLGRICATDGGAIYGQVKRVGIVGGGGSVWIPGGVEALLALFGPSVTCDFLRRRRGRSIFMQKRAFPRDSRHI